MREGSCSELVLFNESRVNKKAGGATVKEGVNIEFLVGVKCGEPYDDIERVSGFEGANIKRKWGFRGRGVFFFY